MRDYDECIGCRLTSVSLSGGAMSAQAILPPASQIIKKMFLAHQTMREQKETIDVGQTRTDAPEGTRFLVLRDNH
jgi:hypothetical protein